MSLVRKGLLRSPSLQCGAVSVTLTAANGELMESGLDKAEISLSFLRHEQPSRRNLGHKHQIMALFYEAGLVEWDMFMGLTLLDIVQARAHRRTLLVEEPNKLSCLSTSMEPRASRWKQAKRDALSQAVRGESTRPSTPHVKDEYSLSEDAFHIPLGELGLSTSQVQVFGSAALLKCSTVWTKEDNGWEPVLRSDLWDLLYSHAPRCSVELVVAKIARDRARAVLAISSLRMEA